ncbi:hypothetical protein LY76DRAFT_342170 [Colletotrichum caudatum]|nr:hypothetical protein LY76DRAFT_342170 [Colletotrichum caudatum]
MVAVGSCVLSEEKSLLTPGMESRLPPLVACPCSRQFWQPPLAAIEREIGRPHLSFQNPGVKRVRWGIQSAAMFNNAAVPVGGEQLSEIRGETQYGLSIACGPSAVVLSVCTCMCVCVCFCTSKSVNCPYTVVMYTSFTSPPPVPVNPSHAMPVCVHIPCSPYPTLPPLRHRDVSPGLDLQSTDLPACLLLTRVLCTDE